MILNELNLPRPKSVQMWLRYFLAYSFEHDQEIFQKQLAALEHGEIDKINLPLCVMSCTMQKPCVKDN